jgi:hypothetical protein
MNVISHLPATQINVGQQTAAIEMAHLADSLAGTIAQVHQLSRGLAHLDSRIRAGNARFAAGAQRLAELGKAVYRPAQPAQQDKAGPRATPLLAGRQVAGQTRPMRQIPGKPLHFAVSQWANAFGHWAQPSRIPEADNLGRASSPPGHLSREGRTAYDWRNAIDPPHLRPPRIGAHSHSPQTITPFQTGHPDTPLDTAIVRQHLSLTHNLGMSLVKTIKPADYAMRRVTGLDGFICAMHNFARLWAPDPRHLDAPQVREHHKAREGNIRQSGERPISPTPRLVKLAAMQPFGMIHQYAAIRAEAAATRQGTSSHGALWAKFSTDPWSRGHRNLNTAGNLNGSAKTRLQAPQFGMWSAVRPPSDPADVLAQRIGGFAGSPFQPLPDALRLIFKDLLAQRFKAAPMLSVVMPAVSTRETPRVQTPEPNPAPVTINYAPVINGAGLDRSALLNVLEQHARDLYRIISRQHERSERLRFK